MLVLALEGDLHRLTHLLRKESADVLDSAGYSSLHYASRAGHLDIVKYLLSAGSVSLYKYLFIFNFE